MSDEQTVLLRTRLCARLKKKCPRLGRGLRGLFFCVFYFALGESRLLAASVVLVVINLVRLPV